MNERISHISPIPQTEKYISKFRFIAESPDQLPLIINERIKHHLKLLHRGHIENFRIIFKLPDEIHILPLYEKMLLDHLIGYHNSYATKERFVNPGVFMCLDENIGLYTPKSLGAKLSLETVSEHEIKHWQILEKAKSDKELYLLFNLFWQKVPNHELEVLNINSGINFSGDKNLPIIQIALAPNYPSKGDYKNMENFFDSASCQVRILHAFKVFLANRAKAKQQGINFFRKPINIDQAIISIYKEWKIKNKNRIRMDVYPDIE